MSNKIVRRINDRINIYPCLIQNCERKSPFKGKCCSWHRWSIKDSPASKRFKAILELSYKEYESRPKYISKKSRQGEWYRKKLSK